MSFRILAKKGANRKYIKTGGTPLDMKSPRATASLNVNAMYPSWRISLLQTANPFGWHEVSREKLTEIREKLAELESLTWNEILVVRKHLNHSISFEDLSREAQRRLAELGQDDVESVISLRLSGAERVFGIMQAGVLKVLWWDPDHRVCPSNLRNT